LLSPILIRAKAAKDETMTILNNNRRVKELKAATGRRAKHFLAIDVHSHIRIPEVTALLREISQTGNPNARQWVSGRSAVEQKRIQKQNLPKETDYKVRLRELDKLRIDIQALAVNLPSVYYYADGDLALRIARISNDGIADFVSHAPDRFVGMASVPLQDIPRAIRELERAVNNLGLRGAWVSSNVQGQELGDSMFGRFWAKAQDLDVPVFIHPLGFTHPERLQKWALWSTIGQPLEEALAMSSLIYEGVMDRYPNLKIGVCHGGGYMPYYIGRHDETFAQRREIRDKLKKRPSAYLDRFYYDTVIFDPDMLGFLVKKAGARKVMMGTDMPYTAPEPVAFIRNARGLGDRDKENMLWRNAAKLLRIAV
jgi:aminocarboxymuconate-semialdehyde decarboxylase